MTAKVENFCVNRHAQQVTVDASKKVCLNCIWYELYFRRNRGNVACWIPTSTGYCLRREQMRGPLRQPCREFEKAR